MNANDLREKLMHQIYQRAEKIVEQKARTLKALLRYEIGVMNTELAMRSKEHGYDFNFLSNSYADNIVITPVTSENGSVTVSITISRHAYKDASDSEVEFFKTFVLTNALKKLNRGN